MSTQAAATAFCRDCGESINAKAEICPKCGVRQLAAPSSLPTYSGLGTGKNKWVAIVLAFFLGGFGAHKFYLDEKEWGIFYIVMCWTLIPALVALVEAFIYLLMSEEEFHRKYNQPDQPAERKQYLPVKPDHEKHFK